MITKANIEQLKELLWKWIVKTEDVISLAEKENELWDKREENIKKLQEMSYFAQWKIRSGEYDSFWDDINSIVDRVQEDMKKDELWEQSDWSVIIETPEDGVEISTETEEETPDAKSLENIEKDV